MDEKLWFMEVRRGPHLRGAFYERGARPGDCPGGKPGWFGLEGRAPDEAAAREAAAEYLRATGDPVAPREVPELEDLVAMTDADFDRWQIRAGKVAGAIEFRDHAAGPARSWLFFGCTLDTEFPEGTL